MVKPKKKINCEIGKQLHEECSLTIFGTIDTELRTFNDCTNDVIPHLKSLKVYDENSKACPNITEKWLIENRTRQKFSNTDEICPKHRMQFGIAWKVSSKCQYPGHKIKKIKKQTKGAGRYISPTIAFEIKHMFSSVVQPFEIAVGSTWCNNCRLRVHPELKRQNIHLLQQEVCVICYKIHANEVCCSSTPKRPRIADSSEDDELEDNHDNSENFQESSKDTFNRSMTELATNYWSPIKFQLRTNLSDVSTKTHQKIIRKSLLAVDNILDNIAPGQSKVIMATLTDQSIENDFIEDLRSAIEAANGSNNKIQLLSLVCTKSDLSYKYTIAELMKMFPVTKHQVEKARKHLNSGLTGVPIEPGKYYRTKVSEEQINHFLDFIQFSGLVQDVASGTRSVRLSTNRKVAMPNVVRTVHKAEIIRLYEGACEKSNHTKENGLPSTRTLWNILQNCPASQRKSLSGLDNIAAEGAESFDCIIGIMKFIASKNANMKNECDRIIKSLTKDKRYLKGEYKSNCGVASSEVADHCRPFALSDPKEPAFQKLCKHKHEKKCQDCEHLKSSLNDVDYLIEKAELTTKEKMDFTYDLEESKKNIEAWKGHILATVHQDEQKTNLLENLDSETAFLIIDFAMKFLSRKYRESMAKWFGKSGHGMHVMCVIFRNSAGTIVKRTYIVFIGKAPQDYGAVITIYEKCLMQIKKDTPHIKFLVDKSDNAGCYHNEDLFSWKAQWPHKNVGLKFILTMFNERQAGKDQCDRDSATAKRQMNYYIERGNNIENANQMNNSLRTATALCGFNSMVLEITEKKIKNTDNSNIKEVKKIHCVKYVMVNNQMKYHVWRYHGLGDGKTYNVGQAPTSLRSKVSVPFQEKHLSLGKAGPKASKNDIIYCSEPLCIKSFTSVDQMLQHLDTEKHEFEKTSASSMDKVKDNWVSRFCLNNDERSASTSKFQDTCSDSTSGMPLNMGWAIPKRNCRRLTNDQKNFLNKLFDDGEKNGCKETPESTLIKMRQQFTPKDYLPISTIKSYFSRRAKNIRTGKIVADKEDKDEESDEDSDENAEAEEQQECERSTAVQGKKSF